MYVDYSESFRSQLKSKVKYTKICIMAQNESSSSILESKVLHPGILCKPRCNKKVIQFKRA